MLLNLGLVFAIAVLPTTHYTFSPGYLADGGDLGELFFDIGVRARLRADDGSSRALRSSRQLPTATPAQDAKQYCDAEPKCKGFTFKETTEPVHKLSVRFKSISTITHDPTWLSYTKSASPNPYFYAAGFLGDGKELHSASLTLADAQAWCDASESCKGFSAEAPIEPSDQIFARFLDSASVTYDGNWMSYTKLPSGKAAGSQSAYTYHPGYLGDGASIHESFMTLDNAKVGPSARAAFVMSHFRGVPSHRRVALERLAVG
jgi:hypothetical protein